MVKEIRIENLDDFIFLSLDKGRNIEFDIEKKRLVSKGCIRDECLRHPNYWYQVR
jgi:hypothetical protein